MMRKMKPTLAFLVVVVTFNVVSGGLSVGVRYALEEPPHAPDFMGDEHEVLVHDGEEQSVEEEEEVQESEEEKHVQELAMEEEELEEEEPDLQETLEQLEQVDVQLPSLPDSARLPNAGASKNRRRRRRRSRQGLGDKRSGGEERRRRKRAATTEDSFWQDCIVPYDIEASQKEWDIKNYHYALDLVGRRTCIQFVKWDSNTKATYNLNHDGYVQFKRAPSGWGFAPLGNRKSPAQQLSCTDSNNCVHEILHALGFEHEQKDPRRHGIIRINWKYITSSLLKSYEEVSNPGAVNMSEPYDISSTLHYRLQYGPQPEMTLLFPELSIQEGSYYQFREVSESYKCKERFCQDYMACENDGYVISRNGVCQCICPDGLDPDTGCTSVFRSTSKATSFPGGQYALPAPLEGCPESMGLSPGSVQHAFPYSWPFDPYLLKGPATYGKVTQHFCVQGDSTSSGAAEWPKGSYCIYRYGGSCPEGFQEGWIQFDNEGTQPVVTEGSVADGVYGVNTKLFYCCRDDASTDVPIALPSTQPFALFPRYGCCQKVDGAKGYRGEIILRSDTADGVFGLSALGTPDTYQPKTGDPNLYLRYCAYYPVNSDCGGVYSLSASNRKVTISSPNYPDNYANNLDCHWFIQGPLNSTLTMTFHDFDLEEVQGKCLDHVEINTYMIGTRGREYCGSNMKRTHRSILNKMHVTLDTNPTGQRKGFKATVEVHLGEEDCFNHGDMGHTYRGKMDYTEEFKTCLPWSHPGLKQCYHYATNPLDINAGLESNYCRNPGDGVRPWCYTNVTGCERGYCDVCQLGTIYDHRSDCAALLAADSSYCQNEMVARADCALTCKDKLPAAEPPKPVTTVKCPNPEVPSDGQPKVALTGTYSVGERVTFQCTLPDSTWTQSTTCLGDGTWSPLTSVCTGCPDGWWPFKASCYWASPVSASFVEARDKCAMLGAEIAEIRDQAAMDVFFHIRDDGVDQWIGLKENGKGNWTWQDGSPLVWNKWTAEPRKSQTDSSAASSEYCATVKFTDDWHDELCTARNHFNCRRIYQEPSPATAETGCVDKEEDCPGWAAGGECQANPGFMKDRCPLSCNACPKDCADLNGYCPYWASAGECERNERWMAKNCQLSCNKCPPSCRDKSGQCAEWQAQGECESNADFMTANCQATCNRCPEQCTDSTTDCAHRVKGGDCLNNAMWMNQHCNHSCNQCPAPGECVGRPCGENKCALVDGVQPVCLCPVGTYGVKCESQIPCVDRAGTAYCSDQLTNSASICQDFPELAWYMCSKTCGKC